MERGGGGHIEPCAATEKVMRHLGVLGRVHDDSLLTVGEGGVVLVLHLASYGDARHTEVPPGSFTSQRRAVVPTGQPRETARSRGRRQARGARNPGRAAGCTISQIFRQI